MKQNELPNCGDLSTDLNNFSVYPLLQQSSQHQSSSSSSSSASSTSTSSLTANKQIENDKTNFFNILKSLFAIFDPECRGSIDLNELDTLGANKNEILTDVISYLRNNRTKSETIDSENEQNKNHSQLLTNSSSSSSSNSAKLVSSNESNNNLNKNETKSINFIKNFKSSSKKSEIRSPSANKINRRLKNFDLISNDALKSESYFVTFEEFVRASEIILNKRKYSKIMQQQQQQQHQHQQLKQFNKLNGSYTPDNNNKKIDDKLISFNSGGSSSCNNLFKASMANAVLPVSEYSKPPQTTLRLTNRNYAQIPINNVITSSSVSTTTSTSSSASSPTTATTTTTTPNSQPIQKQSQSTAATLSQAFEFISNDESSDLLKPAPFPNLPKISNTISQHSTILTNANSCDLNSLIDKKNFILQQCINDLDLLKQSFSNQIKENKVKQSNIQKLKHQNLFSIDKMLLDLKELNDMHLMFKKFIDRKDQDLNKVDEKFEKKNHPNENEHPKNENLCDKINFINSHKENLFDPNLASSNYKEYLDHFENNNQVINEELDTYLKEKQEKIESLQREKSNLIRRLFEMKSDSDSLSKNILQLNTTYNNVGINNNNKNNNNYDAINNQINKQINNANSNNIPKEIPVFKERPNPPGYTTICNFIELGSKSDNSHSNFKSTQFNNSHLKFNHPQQIPINVRNPI